MTHPIQRQIGSVFIPVKDLQRSAEFYSRVFDLPLKKVSAPIYNVELDGTAIITLDVDNFEKPFRDGDVQPSTHGLFFVRTDNIEQARQYLTEIGAELTEVERFGSVAYFYFYDPDRNKIMIYCNS